MTKNSKGPRKSRETWWIYILECANGCHYTGITDDLERRYRQHLDGSARCKYTRSFPPVKVARCWMIRGTRGDAQAVERLIKGKDKRSKERMISEPELLKKALLETGRRLAIVPCRKGAGTGHRATGPGKTGSGLTPRADSRDRRRNRRSSN